MRNTNTASIAYNSASNTFQYTDAANSSDDSANLPLSGVAATLITTSSDWTASLTADISARTMTADFDESPHVWLVFGLFYKNGSGSYLLTFSLQQENNTGGANDENFPDGFYGTGVTLRGRTNGNDDVTVPLGSSQLIQGGSVLLLSGAANASPATEPIDGVTANLTLNYSASMNTVTGYCNGTPVGSYSLAGWGTSPPLTFLVGGSSGSGIDVPSGTATISNFSVAPVFSPLILSVPQFTAANTNFSFLLSGPGGSNYVLQASTNLFNWTSVSTSTIPITGAIMLSNAITGYDRRFYRAYLQ